MHCILPFYLEIDWCVKMWKSERVSCSEQWRITLREWFDRDNVEYRYEKTDRKLRWWSIVTPVVQDSKFLNIPFSVRSDSKEDFYDYYKFLKSVFNVPAYWMTAPRNPSDAPLNSWWYIPITMCMRDWEEMKATWKMIEFRRERMHQDGCGADFSVQYILWNKNCTDEWCWSGDISILQWIDSWTTNHPVPLSSDNCDREFSQQVDFYNLTQWQSRPYPPFPNIWSSLINYSWQWKCKLQFRIEVKTSMQWPIVIYLIGANGAIQTLKIDIPAVSAGDFLLFNPDTWQFTWIISWQVVDAMQYVNMKCGTFPVFCPTPCNDYAEFWFPWFNYFVIMETQVQWWACLSLSCTNKRC